MILTCVVPLLLLLPLPVLLLPHALSRRTKMMLVTRANHRPCRFHEFIDCLLSVFNGHLRDPMNCCRQKNPLIGRFSCCSALDGHFAYGIGPPADQAVFQCGDKHFCIQCDSRKDHHRREDAIRVEVGPRVLDHKADALRRPKELTYNRADSAKLKLVCRLARIHVKADGMITSVESRRWLAPRICAFA